MQTKILCAHSEPMNRHYDLYDQNIPCRALPSYSIIHSTQWTHFLTLDILIIQFLSPENAYSTYEIFTKITNLWYQKSMRYKYNMKVNKNYFGIMK